MPPKQLPCKKGPKSGAKDQAVPSSSVDVSKSALLTTDFFTIPSAASSLNPSAVAPFTLATWNVLADDHVYPHYYPQCSKKQLMWGERLPLLLDRIRQLNPDVLCMQEVDHWKDWEAPLKQQGYTTMYLARGGSKQDGCSIVFKTDRFSLVDRFELRMDDIANFAFNDPQRIRKHCVALGAVLRPTDAPEDPEGEHDIFVVTTHLFWNPKFEDVKLRQAIFLTYHLHQYWGKSSRLVICGDFNSTPDSAIATFLRTGSVDLRTWPLKSISGRGYKGACEGYSVFGIDAQTAGQSHSPLEPIDQASGPLDNETLFRLLKTPVLRHLLHLESAYQNQLTPTQAANGASSSNSVSAATSSNKKSSKQGNTNVEIYEPITSHFKEFSGTLDYIYTSPGVYPISILNVPSDQEMQAIGFIPNDSFASDHLIMMAQLQLATKRT